MENSIEFELTNTMGYSASQFPPPTYLEGYKNYEKLFKVLGTSHEVIRYYALDYVQPKTFTNQNTLIAHYADIFPKVEIHGKEQTLHVEGKFNAAPGYIDLSQDYNVNIHLDRTKNVVIYYIKIPYSVVDPPGTEDPFAIILTFTIFIEWVHAIRLIGHVLNEDVEKSVFNKFKMALDVSGNDINLLDFVYEKAPHWVIAKFGREKVYSDMKLMLKGTVNEIGSNEEVAILKMLRSFVTPPFLNDKTDSEESGISNLKENISQYTKTELRENTNFLLEKCVTEKIDGITVFEQLYSRLNNFGGADNFDLFIKLFYLIWLESKYPGEEYNDNDVTDILVIDYDSKKIFGFNDTSHDLKFEREYLLVHEERIVRYNYPKEGEGVPVYDMVYAGKAHLYQPINVPSLEKSGKLMFPENIIPAFCLKAIDDNNYWEDFEKASWLAVDVITTASGFGNLLKLRHLAKIGQVTNSLKQFIAGVEVVDGVLGIALQLISDCEEGTFCDKLRTFLIYLDLATLGADSLTSKYLRKSAKEALDAMPMPMRKKQRKVEKMLEDFAARARRESGGVDKSYFDAGGLLLGKYLTRKTLIGQSTEYTCVATSLKMVLAEKGIKFTEMEIAGKLNTTVFGARILDIPDALIKMKVKRLKTTSYEKVDYSEFEKMLKPHQKAIVSVKIAGKPDHAMVVDKIQNKKVFIRDPLPLESGSTYTLDSKTFEQFFNKRFVIIN